MDFSLKRLFLVISLFSIVTLYSQDKYAIIIGNSDYTSIKDLPIVKNDTIDVSRKFKELGYMVSTLADPSKEDIQGYFSSLKYTITQDSTVIFYYAGHGVQVDSRDYIVTKDIEANIDSLEDNSVSVSWIMGSLYKSKATTIIMFMDACRNNPFPSKTDTRGMKVVTKDVKTKGSGARKKLGVVYSTNSGDTAYDSVRGFKNSPFTTAFLNNISIPNESFDTILNKISLDVGLYTKGTQAIDTKIDFKEELVLNTNMDQKVTISESYNSLVVKGYGILKVIANDECMVTINNGSEFFFDSGEARTFDYEVGKHIVKLSGENKTEELRVKIKEASTTQLYFNDYNGEDDYNREDKVEFVKFDTPKEPKIKEPVSLQPEMVFVKAGKFKMGSPKNEKGRKDDEYQHTVRIKRDFYIGKYEVTQELYRAVMGEELDNKFKGDKLPVDNIDYYNAIEFCNRLSELNGLEPAYSFKIIHEDPKNNDRDVLNVLDKTYVLDSKRGFCYKAEENKDANGYRLPTERQWEYAARGGSNSGGYIFAGSNIADDVSWYNKNSGFKTHEGGEKMPNEIGIYDMSGNVQEICFDFYFDYPGSKTRIADTPGYDYVIRGGSFRQFENEMRVAKRMHPGGNGLVGFRLLLYK